jgi:hypothetical protein
MSFGENKKIILKSCEAFLKLQIVDCGSKLSCRQDKMIKNLTLKPYCLKRLFCSVILNNPKATFKMRFTWDDYKNCVETLKNSIRFPMRVILNVKKNNSDSFRSVFLISILNTLSNLVPNLSNKKDPQPLPVPHQITVSRTRPTSRTKTRKFN